jgi:hypothetical protein
MISESVISLLPIFISYTESITRRIQRARHAGVPVTEEDEVEPPERLVPMSWVGIGLAVSSILGIVLVWIIFGNEGIRPWATALGLVLASILSVLGVRALGQTDLNPVVSNLSTIPFRVSNDIFSLESAKSASWSSLFSNQEMSLPTLSREVSLRYVSRGGTI